MLTEKELENKFYEEARNDFGGSVPMDLAIEYSKLKLFYFQYKEYIKENLGVDTELGISFL